MKLIILRGDNSKSLTLDYSKYKHRLIFILLFFIILFTGAYSAWFLYISDKHQFEENKFISWKTHLAEHEQEFSKIKIKINNELSAISNKVAELQSRVIRLDALGEKIAINSKLDNGEFDFSQRPPLGGPTFDVNDVVSVSKNEINLYNLLNELSYQIQKSEQQLDILDQQLLTKTNSVSSFVAGKPVLSGWISSKFGHRIDPFTGNPAWHKGIDFAGKFGDKIVAVASGVVTFSGKKTGYGNLIEINHGNGYVTRYAHNQSHLVLSGDIVEKGQIIAEMGSTGRSTGPHVHFEVLRNNKPMNPERYIFRSGL